MICTFEVCCIAHETLDNIVYTRTWMAYTLGYQQVLTDDITYIVVVLMCQGWNLLLFLLYFDRVRRIYIFITYVHVNNIKLVCLCMEY